MPLRLNIFEKIGILHLNRGPAPIVDLLGMLSFKAIVTALRLGIFEIIGTSEKSAEDISASVDIDLRGASLLLELMEDLGYVRLRRGLYRNTRSTRKWLLVESKSSIAALFHHFNDMSCRWDYLDATIRRGTPQIMGWEWLDRHPERWHAYHAGMKSSAILICGELMKKIKIPSKASSIIDLGGSHGQYCIEFCRQHPDLTGVVYDWAPAEKTAVENIKSSHMSGRIAFRAGDFMTDPIGSPYDVILMFNIIRIFKPDDLRSLFRKIHGSMASRGMIIIMDHLGHRPGSRFMSANALLLLLELYNSTEGRIHKKKDVSRLLSECGYGNVRDFNLPHSPGLGVITATKA